MKRVLIILAIFLPFPLAVFPFAQAPADTLKLSLERILNMAVEHGRSVKISSIESDIRAEITKDDEMEKLPDLGIMGIYERTSNLPVYENGIFSAPTQHAIIHDFYKAGSDFSLNIYNGNKLNLKIKEDKISHAIGDIQRNQTISDIHYKAASVYLELEKSIIFRGVILNDIDNQSKQLEKIMSIHRNGVVLKSDVLRAELDLSKRRLTLVEINNDILIANQKLNIIIGTADNLTIIPADSLLSVNDSSGYDGFLATAVQNSYAGQITEKQTELAALAQRQIKNNKLPSVSMYGYFYYSYPQIFLYPYNPYLYSLGGVGIKVSYSISSLFKNVHKENIAKLNLSKEEEIHRDTEDKIRQQTEEAYLRYKEAIVQVEVARNNVSLALENARIIKSSYFNHASLITDLLDADTQVLRSQFELATDRILVRDRYYLLQNIIGKF